MNVIVGDAVQTTTQPTQHSATKNTRPLLSFPQNPSKPASWIPLYLNCLGGNWQGQIRLLQAGLLELQLQGFPPVQAGQEIQFQGFGTTPTRLAPLQKGQVQHLHRQRGSSAWEGTTQIIVQEASSSTTHKQAIDPKKNSFYTERGSFVLGKISEKDKAVSRETDSPTYGAPHVTSRRFPQKERLSPEACPVNGHIHSARFSINNLNGHAIMAYHDYPTETDFSRLPIVVIAPGYGETKRDYLTLAYFFASNGFHVIRYDHTNHVGESHGRHVDTSLSSMKQDFQAMTQFAHRQWPHSPIIGVASSLASRVALKAEAEAPSLALLVLLVGIVDVQHSLATVHQEDIFDNYFNGQVQESANILGFNVGRVFLDDAIRNKFVTLQQTLEDAQALETSVMYVSAGNDAWIDGKDLEEFKQAIVPHLSKWLEVPEGMHRLQENPKIARATYHQIIEHACESLGLASPKGIQEPNRLDMGRQKRLEKTALQQHAHTNVGQAFWSDYLGHFQTVGKCQDYVQLLDHVFHALDPITPGQRFLDAGCGNGNAALFFLQGLQDTHHTPRLISEHPIHYVGIDVIHEALGRAKAHLTHAYRSLQQTCAAEFPSVQMSWSQVDLQRHLPFPDNHFDRIVSNLVLGYVADPQAVLQELFRVLVPGGRMVISNLKPNGDFSGIYQNLVNQLGHMNQKAEARELLNNYGKIRQAEKEGQFRFFDQSEWRNILASMPCVHAEVFPTFANQAYLIALEKPVTSTVGHVLPFQETTNSFPSETPVFQNVA